MIFFGSKGKVVVGEKIQGVQCPSCENSQFVTFGILNYFHLYWIPTFLKSRKVGIECMHCKRTLIDDEVPSHLAERIKSSIFTPINTLPMFSGLFIIALLSLGVMYSVQQDSAREEAYFAQPAVNDYYLVDFSKIFVDVDDEYNYGVMRVTNVMSTKVQMQISNKVSNSPLGLGKDIREGNAATDSYYSPETVNFEFGELQEYKDAGAIYSIDRR